MKLVEYQETRGRFEKNGFAFEVVKMHDVPHRLVCQNLTPSNRNGTNGVRLDGTCLRQGWHAFITEEDFPAIVDALTEESVLQNIRFVKDDRLTEELGEGVFVFYKMSVLRSAVVA